MNAKPKICIRCEKPNILKGHKLCQNCYNIEYWKWDDKRPTRTFAEAMRYKYLYKGKIVQEEPKEPTKRVKKQRSERQRAGDRADQWFSRYIRLKYAFNGNDGEVYAKCYTCGSIKPIKGKAGKIIECGHWIRREFYNVRHHENNARPQCHNCNYFKQGKPEVFEQLLKKEIGSLKVDKLKVIFTLDNEVTAYQLRESSKYYRELVKQLQEKHNINYW